MRLLKILALDDSEPISYKFSIPPERVRDLLTGAVQAERTSLFRYGGYHLRFKTERDFRLSHLGGRNSWRRALNASLQGDANETRLNGRFRVSGFITAFTLLWLVATLGSAIALAVSSGMEMGIVFVLPVAGVAIAHFGRMISRRDERAVLELLDKTFAGEILAKETPGYEA